MPWNQSTIDALVDQGYGPNDPQWRAALHRLAEHTPEPDWDQMRADLGIRRDPIMEILDEPNLPIPRLSGDMEMPRDAMAVAVAAFRQRALGLDDDDRDSVIFQRYVLVSSSGLSAFTQRYVTGWIDDDVPTVPVVSFRSHPEPTADDPKKELDRERMRKHVAEQRRKQRGRR